MTKNCGRIDDHPPHNWVGREESDFWYAKARLNKVTYRCEGRPVMEGAQR